MINLHPTPRAAIVSAAMLMACIGTPARAYDWLQFDFTPDKAGNNTLEKTINAANVSQLKLLFNVALPAGDNPDGPPALLTSVSTPQGVKDLVFVQGTHGDITAFDAHTGAIVWTKAFASAHANNATAAIDPNRQFVYINTATQAHKLNVGDGSEVTGGGWPETTSAGAKTSCQLTIATAKDGNTYLYCANEGVASITTINLATGTQHVFNTAASDQPDTHSPTQMESGANPWSRGMAYDASLDRLFVACGTNNGPNWIPGHVWRQSYLALAADGSTQVTNGLGWPVDSYTPTNWSASVKSDQDICSGGLGILPVGLSSKYPHLGVNPGKDHNIRILNLANMSGQGGPGHTGGELFFYSFSAMSLMRAECCVWTNPADGQVWVFASGNNGIAGFKVLIDGSGNPSLSLQWSDIPGGIHWTTSSFVANNVLYAAVGGGEDTTSESHHVDAMDPTTGKVLWSGAIDEFHWASPILANGILYMADGNSGGFSGPGGHLRAWSLGTPPPPPVADPTFAPPAGDYTSPQSVAISTTTSGASIRYTLDNTIPSETAGTLYSGTPVLISGTSTLKAIAYKSGMSDSNVVIGDYTISSLQQAAAPVFTPPGGTYTGPQTVAITSSTAGVSLRYTTDGSTPTETNGTLYTGPITLAPGVTITLQAIAYGNGFLDSNVTSASYTINSPSTTETYEAETSGHVSGPPSMIEIDPNASGGEWVLLGSTATGQFIQYNIGTAGGGGGPMVPAGTYSLSMRYLTGSGFGTLSLSVDGVQIGGTLDEYAASTTYPTMTFGTVTFATTDNHIIQLTVTGKNGASSSFALSADSFTFTPVASTVNLEAESLSPTGTGATVSTSNDANASGGVVEFLNATAASQAMNLTASGIPAGTYSVQFRYKTNTSRGRHTVTIDGMPVGGTLDQYATTQAYLTANLGNVTLSGSGTHTIVLTVTGKNSAASQFYITADKFTLTPQSGGGLVAAPSFSPGGGTYATAQNVTITSATPGASIRYTTDGSTPTETNGLIYSGPVNISNTASPTLLQAIAYEAGMTDSTVTSATYTIGSPPPVFNLEAESGTPVGTGATVSFSNDPNASGGVLVFLNSTAAGQAITWTTPAMPAGTYQVQLRYKTNTTRGIHNLTVDGMAVGGTLDQYATTQAYLTKTFGNVTLTSSGAHIIVMTVTGKNSAATAFYLTADKFTFTGQ